MFDFLSYNFILYGLLIATLIAASSALISPFLVLNEQALIADGLAHVGFTGIVVGLLFSNEPLFISIPIVVLFSVLVKYLSQNQKINGDAALGLLSAIALAIGLVIIHKSSGFNSSIETMLVGSLWTVSSHEIILAAIAFVLVLLFVIFNYQKLLLLTFDYKYAKFKKSNANLLSYILAILTAVVITIGVKTIGTLLISSFVIFPALIGMQFRKGFKYTLISGIIISIIGVFLGIFIADFVDIPAGSSIVLIYAVILFSFMLISKFKKRGLSYD